MSQNLVVDGVVYAEQAYAEYVALGERKYGPNGGLVPISADEREQTFLHRWERMVALFGERPAVEEAGRILTYDEFNRLANQLAHAILARQDAAKLASDAPVALLVDVEGDLPIGVIATWKAGKFLTWLEARQPFVRNQFMVEESGATIIVTNRKHEAYARQLRPHPEDVIVIEELADDLPVSNPPITIDSSSPAYIIYTSGSTGKPKGTLEIHRNLIYVMAARQMLFHFGPNDRATLLLYGVGCMFSMASVLLFGGCLLPYQMKNEGFTRFSKWLIDSRVTLMVGGADLRTWLLSLDGSQQFPALRSIALSTGPSYREHVEAYQRYLPDSCTLINLYSATEFRCGGFFIINKKTRFEGRILPVGYSPMPTSFEIWDEAENSLPLGSSGEVVVCSPYIAAGYWKSPELSASKFGVDGRGRRYFRTGDLGRLDKDGCLWVLGRMDAQFKIRGNRVESAEVEVAMHELPDVQEAAVIHQGETDEDCILVGFVSTTGGLSGNDLRKQLAATLPDYMIPSMIVVLDELPRNPNGKVDRPALRAMQVMPRSVNVLGRENSNLAGSLLSASITSASVTSADKPFAQPLTIGKKHYHPTGEHIPITLAEIEQSVLHRWESIVARYGDNRALEEGERTLTYAELNAQMNLVAHTILARQVRRNQPIATLFDVEGDLAVGVFGIWKAGNFFVLLEPGQPLARHRQIIEDSEAALVVTNRRHAQIARDLYPDQDSVIVIEELVDEAIGKQVLTNPAITLDGDSPAYLIYTSGSTGKPKGAIDNHRNLLEMMVVRQSLLHFSTQDRLNLLVLGSGWSFATLGALLYGGCLLPYRVKEEGYARFSQWLIDRRVTMTIGGSVLRSWLLTLDGHQSFPDLRVLTMGASPSYLEHLHAYQRYLSEDAIFLNTYSATEVRSCTIFAMDKTTRLESRMIPAGYPTLQGAVEIWDENDKPLPVGETGEVIAITPYTAVGYWKLPELTASRFGVDGHGRRYYRMGDLGRIDSDGCLWVLGRKDGQIKIRGNRVEIAEVEVALMEMPAVNEAAVIAIGETDETRVLVAYVTVNKGTVNKGTVNKEITGKELRKELAAQLPDFMVPTNIVVLERLPRNANGKVDRPALRAMKTPLAHSNGSNATALDILSKPTIATVLDKTNGKQAYAHAQSFHPTGEHVPITPDEMERSVIHRWDKIVEQYGENLALEDSDHALTYSELNTQINRVAHAILARQLPKEKPIGVLFDIEADFPIGVFAIWKAGHFFVWLEPNQPSARHQYILEDSEATLIVTNRNHAQVARNLVVDESAVIAIDELLEQTQEALAATNPPITIKGDSIAYLLYTSGSTGKPKGTIDNHRNILGMMVARQRMVHFSTRDRVNYLSMGSGWAHPVFGAWLYGGCLLPFQVKVEGFARFSQWLIDRRITMAVGGASLRPWLLTLDGNQTFPDLRLVSIGAGQSYLEHLQAYQRYLPDSCLFLNTYAATEVRSVTLLLLDKNSDFNSRFLPAGYPTIFNAIEIWDEDDNVLPFGEPGEIVVITEYAALQYWKSPELTASRFGVDRRGRRYYRMGDLGRLDSDGCLWVLGRKDGQIKIRGNRVEIAEVEVALMEMPAVNEAAVIAIGETDETRVLVAYVTVNKETTDTEIRKKLAAQLPDYMIPTSIVILDQLPRNANGKVDRPTLRAMKLHPQNSNGLLVMNSHTTMDSHPALATVADESNFDRIRSFHPTGSVTPITPGEIELSSIHRWEKIVALYGDNLALEEGEQALTYREANGQMNLVAHAVLARQLSKEIPVAILFDIESDLNISIFGIWKAGNFFVWLEPNQPPSRHQFMVEDSGATLIVTNRKHAQLANALFPDKNSVIIIEDLLERADNELVATNPPITIDGSSPAYILYTSGSTGKPKGTVDLHRSLLEAMAVRQRIFNFSSQDRIPLLMLSSGWTVATFGTLFFGGCLLPYRGSEEGLARLGRWLFDRRITIVNGGSLVRAWLLTLDGSRQYPLIRVVAAGAGPSYREHTIAFQKFLPDHAIFVNLYAATELRSCAIFVMDKSVQLETRLVPVGYACPHVEIEIWDEQGNPQLVGNSGEIVAYSSYAALGYWKLPEETASRFGVDKRGRRYYRTGDLGRLDEEGRLWLLGRIDGQVKIRSNRVETAEVEIALRELDGVEEAAVVVIGESDETRTLIGYVASKAELVGNNLRKQLAARLPEYMIPSTIVVLGELPCNSNGKVARPMLRDMAIAFSKVSTPIAAVTAENIATTKARDIEIVEAKDAFQTETERRVAALINELLEGVKMGRHDNFFDMGGHSLLAARLMLVIHRTFGVDLTPRDFLADPTVAGLSSRIDRILQETPRHTLLDSPIFDMGVEMVPLVDGLPTNLPIFSFPGWNGARENSLRYELVIRQLRNQWPFYGFVVDGRDENNRIFATLDELVGASLRLMRRVQPHGPYALIGACTGGKLAYALANTLMREGEEISALIFLDVPAIPRAVREAALGTNRTSLRTHAVRLKYRFDYHRKEIGNLGFQNGTRYLAEHLSALLPPSMHPNSPARQRQIAHNHYTDVLSNFTPKEPYNQPVSAIFTPAFKDHQGHWQKLMPLMDITVIEAQHLDFIRTHTDEVGRMIRKALEPSASK